MYAWERDVDSADRCQQCKIIAYTDHWRGKYETEGYICSGCLTGHFHGDMKKEIERLRWEQIRLTQRCKDLETALLTALAAQKES